MSEENPGGPLDCFGAAQRSDDIVGVAFDSVKPPLEVGNFPAGLKTQF